MAQAQLWYPSTGPIGSLAKSAETSFIEPPAVTDHAKPTAFLRERNRLPPPEVVGKEECTFRGGQKSIAESKSDRFVD